MRLLASSILILGILLLNGPLQTTAAGASDEPPWKRLLTGDLAKRVAELGKKILEFYETARYAAAPEPAREALEIPARQQGPPPWQRISAKKILDLMTQIPTLPKDAQDALTEATKLKKNELPNGGANLDPATPLPWPNAPSPPASATWETSLPSWPPPSILTPSFVT